MYKEHSYQELYYETSVNRKPILTNASVYPMNEIRENLRYITYKLGLSSLEQSEFITYWMERLKKLRTPYVSVSLIDHTEKEKIDHVTITPVPDTFIQMLFCL